MKYALYGVMLVVALFSQQAFASNHTDGALVQPNPLMQVRIQQLEKSIENLIAKDRGGSTRENTGNPAISLVANFTADQTRSRGSSVSSNFLPLSEAEFIFAAYIDPIARLDVTLTAAEDGMAVEEGFITSKLSYGLNLKSGRKFLPVGRVNEVHPHTLVYADRPNILVNMFGSEVFVGDGMWLERPWFVGDSVQTLTIGVFSTENDVAFDPTAARQYAGLARWTGMWDTSDFSTLELGWSYVKGKNGITADTSTTIHAAHGAWKYQNIQDFTLNIESEWLQSRKLQDSGSSLEIQGGYLLVDLGLNRRWQLFSRYDYSDASHAQTSETALTAGLVWKISEFQKLGLQYKDTQHSLKTVADELGIAVGERASSWIFRWVVAIGPHGAHRY